MVQEQVDLAALQQQHLRAAGTLAALHLRAAGTLAALSREDLPVEEPASVSQEEGEDQPEPPGGGSADHSRRRSADHSRRFQEALP
jgi:hypothetical protein